MSPEYRVCRRIVLGNMILLALLLPLVASTAVVGGDWGLSPGGLVVTLVIALVVAVTSSFVPRTMHQLLPPLAADLDDRQAREQAVGRFTMTTGLATVAALGPAGVAGAMAIAFGTPLAYVMPFLLAEIVAFRYVLPRAATVAAMERRLDANGTRSHLAEELARPAGRRVPS